MERVYFALIMSAIAGLSTGIGSVVAYFIKKPKLSYLSFSFGLSAGVMTYIAFIELLHDSIDVLTPFPAIGLFFTGMLVFGVIDYFLPDTFGNNHGTKNDATPQMKNDATIPVAPISDEKLYRTGLLITVALLVHSFIESLATFGTTLYNPGLGLVFAVLMIFHKIPEGLSVSIPIYYATGNKRKAFLYSFVSGLTEPVGALFGCIIILPFIPIDPHTASSGSPVIMGLLAFVAGVMVYLSLDNILPTAHKYGNPHVVAIGVIIGLFSMAVSLAMLGSHT